MTKSLLIAFLLGAFALSVAYAPVFQAPDKISLVFVGDIMLARGVESSVKKNGGGDFHWLFSAVGELAHATILFGNLEGPLSDQGENHGSKYSFRMAPVAAVALARAGFDVLSVANNHSGDWGIEGLADTAKRLTAVKIIPVGFGLNHNLVLSPKMIMKNGFKIGFLAASDVGPNWLEAREETPGIALANDQDWLPAVEKAAKQVDLLIVSYHFGEEYQSEPTARQRLLAEATIDAGASIVVGHHPHVVGPVERYRGGVIAYSLGNFIFDQYFSPETMQGLVLQIDWDRSGLLEVKSKTASLDRFFQPTITDGYE